MLQISINGSRHRCAEGSTILEALHGAGVEVPALCHDSRLELYGACRLCMVQVEGQARPVASCCTPVVDGMAISTELPELEQLRRTNLELMTARYPARIAAREVEHPFHRLLARHQVNAGDAPAAEVFRDDSHPYIGVAMERCINCYRCVRICDEVQGQFVWGIWRRGEDTMVAPRRGATLLEGGCVGCGACVDTCPSGALFDKRSPPSPARWTRTTCVYCGVGCQMEVAGHDGHVLQIRPADSPVNRGHLCIKGRYAYEFGTAEDRVTSPLIRRDGAWHKVSWDAAFDFIAARLTDIVARDGADAIGVLGSARATNEENYLAQKFARVVLGTNNVDCCARVCHTPSAKALKTMLGTGAATNAYDDIERAATIMLCGCNPTENHPIVGARIKQAVIKGARLIVIDPRRTELAGYADLHLALRPGHNIQLLNAMAATIIEEGLADENFLRRRVTGLAEFSDFIRDYAAERVADACGVPAAEIRAAARLYAHSRPAMCFHGLGVTEHLQGTEGVMALINLALLCGQLGVAGGGVNPLRGQNNVQGSAQMGCDPATLTGSQSIKEAGAAFAARWRSPLPASHGLDLMQMMDAAQAGKLKALWAFGYDIYLSLANAAATASALRNLELLVVQDLFLNETAKAYGTVFLPAASFLERDGTFMNSDRRVQRIRKIVEPPGEARPDWWIIQALAQRMGHGEGFSFADPEAIWNEVRALWPAGAGLSYARIADESLHWPCPSEDHPGTEVLHAEKFAGGPTAALQCIPYIATAEKCDADYPLLLITGRTLYQFNAGTMTCRTPNAALRPADLLDMAPADAAALGLKDGQQVRLTSRYGEAALPLRIAPEIKPGEVFATFHRPDLFINRVTSPHRDRLVHSPEYKVTAVRVAPLD